MIQDVRKRDDKARTFAPPDNTIKLTKDQNKKVNKHLVKLKNLDDIDPARLSFDKIKRPQDLKRDKFLKNMNEFERIDLNDVNGLIDIIKNEITEKDNIVDLGNNKEIYFRDLFNFLHDVKDGKINDFNKEGEYEKRLKNTEEKFTNRTKYSEYTRLYEQSINMLRRILFTKNHQAKA